MNSVRKFLALAGEGRWLLVRAALLLTAVRIARAVLPWRALRRVVSRAARPARGAPGSGRESSADLRWSVDVASRYVPGATCLTQALALQIWLGRRGQAAELRLGVARRAGARLEAHAWLESEGQVILGAAERPRYTPLPPLERRDA